MTRTTAAAKLTA